MLINRLLPPGAGDEKKFLQKCIQCGKCVEACRFDALKITRSLNPLRSGTPYIDPDKAPCFLCMHCGPACPTGAIPVIEQKDADMGVAYLDKDKCYTYMGTVICRTCFEKCPMRNTAIILEDGVLPVVTDKCVGCGMCSYVCPRKAITLIPRKRIHEKVRSLT
jgi:ferredoxin-type protein NapG